MVGFGKKTVLHNTFQKQFLLVNIKKTDIRGERFLGKTVFQYIFSYCTKSIVHDLVYVYGKFRSIFTEDRDSGQMVVK